MTRVMTHAGERHEVEWPSPGRELYFQAEPRLLHLYELAKAAAQGPGLPWSAVTALLDALVGQKRDVSICTWRAPALDLAQRNLGSREVREAMLAELQALALDELTRYP